MAGKNIRTIKDQTIQVHHSLFTLFCSILPDREAIVIRNYYRQSLRGASSIKLSGAFESH